MSESGPTPNFTDDIKLELALNGYGLDDYPEIAVEVWKLEQAWSFAPELGREITRNLIRAVIDAKPVTRRL